MKKNLNDTYSMKIKFFIPQKNRAYVPELLLQLLRRVSQYLAYMKNEEEIIIEACEQDNKSKASKSLCINRKLACVSYNFVHTIGNYTNSHVNKYKSRKTKIQTIENMMMEKKARGIFYVD